MKVGVDYYPEMREKSLWQKDAELMAQTGIKIVRIGKNSWCRLEPSENKFNFELFDEFISLFARYGIGTVICIPTGTPPRWLGERCINSERFIERAVCLINEMSRHFSQNKAVVEWQLDSRENGICLTSCSHCNTAFVNWLKDKYDTLEQINNIWGTVADGGEYSDWEQVRFDDDYGNPAFLFDRIRFASDKNAEYIKHQMSIIVKNIPKARISVSSYCLNPYNELECADMVCYESFNKNDVFELDRIRGIKNRGFEITFTFSITNPIPNTLRGYALQAFAHSADTVFFNGRCQFSVWRCSIVVCLTTAVYRPDVFLNFLNYARLYLNLTF